MKKYILVALVILIYLISIETHAETALFSWVRSNDTGQFFYGSNGSDACGVFTSSVANSALDSRNAEYSYPICRVEIQKINGSGAAYWVSKSAGVGDVKRAVNSDTGTNCQSGQKAFSVIGQGSSGSATHCYTASQQGGNGFNNGCSYVGTGSETYQDSTGTIVTQNTYTASGSSCFKSSDPDPVEETEENEPKANVLQNGTGNNSAISATVNEEGKIEIEGTDDTGAQIDDLIDFVDSENTADTTDGSGNNNCNRGDYSYLCFGGSHPNSESGGTTPAGEINKVNDDGSTTTNTLHLDDDHDTTSSGGGEGDTGGSGSGGTGSGDTGGGTGSGGTGGGDSGAGTNPSAIGKKVGEELGCKDPETGENNCKKWKPGEAPEFEDLEGKLDEAKNNFRQAVVDAKDTFSAAIILSQGERGPPEYYIPVVDTHISLGSWIPALRILGKVAILISMITGVFIILDL